MSHRDPGARVIAMVGTSIETMGGISSVVRVYQASGLFDRWPIRYFSSHRDGSLLVKLRYAASALWSYFAALIGGRVALVHVHLASRGSFWRKALFVLPALALRIPVIIHLHGAEFMQFFRRESGRLKRSLIRFLFDRASIIIALSDRWMRLVGEITSNPRVVPIFNPIDNSHVVRPPRKAREPATLLFLGRLGSRKGIFDLLESVALMRAEFPALRLLCGGDGDVEGVRRRARQLGMEDRIQLLGWISGKAKQDLLETATIYVLPSHAEGLPMGVLEAMASGIPVIATIVGGIPDAIEDGVTGLLVVPGDEVRLAAALTRLLRDGDLRARIAQAALEKIDSTFSAERVVPQIEAIYSRFGIVPLDTRHARELG